MAIGGFSGSDAAPTLAQFKQLVAAGKIHYFIGGGQGGGPGGSGGPARSPAGCSRTSRPRTVGGTTVYDLTKATSVMTHRHRSVTPDR